ncbi:MAG TPA: hypothetical protein VIJ95_18195 [Hanamia sp.]
MKKIKQTNASYTQDYSMPLQKNKVRLFRLLPVLLFLGLITGLSCDKGINSTGGYFGGACGSVDSVKSALPGEISAYITGADKNADYFIILGSSSSMRYRGGTNSQTDWVFFPGLPSGTYNNCMWIVSGCSATSNGGEAKVHGPTQVTVE